MREHVYVVSYVVHKNIEPIITVFDNEESAQVMHDHLLEKGLHVWMDECPLYSRYIVRGEIDA